MYNGDEFTELTDDQRERVRMLELGGGAFYINEDEATHLASLRKDAGYALQRQVMHGLRLECVESTLGDPDTNHDDYLQATGAFILLRDLLDLTDAADAVLKLFAEDRLKKNLDKSGQIPDK